MISEDATQIKTLQILIIVIVQQGFHFKKIDLQILFDKGGVITNIESITIGENLLLKAIYERESSSITYMFLKS